MSDMTNITNATTIGPGHSCLYLGSQAPASWKETNFTGAACSLPNCEDNRDSLEKCCTGGTITAFNDTITTRNGTINAEYLACAIDASAIEYDEFADYNPNDPYQAYQDCLVREGASRLVCNNPNRDAESQCYGGASSITTPGGIGGDYFTLCGVNTDNENATGSLLTCCMSANGTVRSELYGCEVSCSGDETLQRCMSLNNHGWSSSCSNYSSDFSGGGSGSGSGGDTGAASTVSGSGKMTLAVVMALSVAVLVFFQ